MIPIASNNPASQQGTRFSVCMATYNGAKYLRAQIDSILSQLRPDDELLVSDDGSSDDTIDILRDYGAALRIVGQSRVGGVVPNFARVLGAASGDFIALADQDDVWLAGRLDRMRAELASVDLVMTNARVVDSQLRSVANVTLFDQLHPSTGLLHNVWKNSFVGCCMGFRRSLLARALPLPSDTPWHDWLIGLLACQGGEVRLVDTPYLLYRRHDANASATGTPSRNGLIRKLILRLQIIRALSICVGRASSQGA